MDFISHWQKNISEHRNMLKYYFSEEKLSFIESYLEEAESMTEAIPCGVWEIARDIESYSDESIAFTEEQERILYADILSTPISGEEIVPDSFSFSPEEAEGRKRLGLSREIALNPIRILEIVIPAISDSITALEDDKPERAEAIKSYAKRLFNACIG